MIRVHVGRKERKRGGEGGSRERGWRRRRGGEREGERMEKRERERERERILVEQ